VPAPTEAFSLRDLSSEEIRHLRDMAGFGTAPEVLCKKRIGGLVEAQSGLRSEKLMPLIGTEAYEQLGTHA